MFASIFENEISLQPSSLCYLSSGLFSFVNELEGLPVLERLQNRHPQISLPYTPGNAQYHITHTWAYRNTEEIPRARNTVGAENRGGKHPCCHGGGPGGRARNTRCPHKDARPGCASERGAKLDPTSQGLCSQRVWAWKKISPLAQAAERGNRENKRNGTDEENGWEWSRMYFKYSKLTNEQLKRYSMSLIVKECESKLQSNASSHKMAKIKKLKQQNNKHWHGCEEIHGTLCPVGRDVK